eukprot:SAG11_NODE_1461_length_4868_cov_31.265255_2_plen_444_part_00
MDEDSSSPISTRRASAPVSSSKDDKEFNQLVLRLQGSAGWRSIFQGKDPFSGAFEDADPGAAAKKTAALFTTFASVCDTLRVENAQLSNRLIAAESDKAGLLAAAGSHGGSKGGQEEDKHNKWRKNFKFNKTFNAGLDENVEEFLLDLKQAFQRAQVKNEEQRLSTLLGALGGIVSSDYARKSEKLEQETGQVLDYEQSVRYLRKRWPRLQTRSEILARFKVIKQGRGQDVRAFLVELDNLLELMKTHRLERSTFDIVDALKDKCDTRIVAKIKDLPNSEEDEDLQWWCEMLVKHHDAAAAVGALNAMGDDDDRPVRRKGKGDGRGARRRGKGAGRFGGAGAVRPARDKPKMEKIHDAKTYGDKYVAHLYTRGDAQAKELWEKRKALRASGGKPQDSPELFALDTHCARWSSTGEPKPGYPVPVCVTCGLTYHTAGTHKNKSK